MRERARVQSTRTLLDVRAAIIEFLDTVRATFASVESDINRVDQWVNHDRPAYWKREVRRREDAVQHAKLEIERKRLIRAPEPASVVFEQKMLTRARDHLESAKRRQEATRRWGPAFEKQAMLAKSASRDLTDSVQVHLPRSVALLERMVASLESYAALRHESQTPGDIVLPDPDAPESPGAADATPRADGGAA